MSDDWAERYRLKSKEWCEADAAASLLEETKSANLSQMMMQINASSISKSEMLAKGSPSWMEYVHSMVEARKAANLLKVELEWIRMQFSKQQSAEATARVERRL